MEQKQKQPYIPKIPIPHYVLEETLLSNKYILPVYIFIKKQLNQEDKATFYLSNFIEFYQEDNLKKNTQQIIEAFLFLLIGFPTMLDYKNYYEENPDELNRKLDKIKDEFQKKEARRLMKQTIVPCFICDSIEYQFIKYINNIIITKKPKKPKELIFKTLETLDSETLNSGYLESYKKIEDYMKKHGITVINNSKSFSSGFLYIPMKNLSYLEWIYKTQNYYANFIQNKIIPSDAEKNYQSTLNMINLNPSKSDSNKLNFVIILTLYTYIYRMWDVKVRNGQKPIIPKKAIREQLHLSYNVISSYLQLLEDYKLYTTRKIVVHEGEKPTTEYYLSSDWEEIYSNRENYGIYKNTIIPKDSCQTLVDYYVTPEIPAVNKGGRPKKQV